MAGQKEDELTEAAQSNLDVDAEDFPRQRVESTQTACSLSWEDVLRRLGPRMRNRNGFARGEDY